MKWLLFSFMLLQLQTLLAQSPIRAIVRSDNSFVTYDDAVSKTVPAPQMVNAKISAIYARYKNDPFATGYKPLVFKTSYTGNVDIYVLKIHSAAGITYKFLAYDHRLQKITSHPITIFGGFMENNEAGFDKSDRLLACPYLYFKNKQIVIKERTHNGTFHNAEDDHYFVLNKNLQFSQVLCLESKTIDAMSGCLITRELRNDTLICTTGCKESNPKLIGKVMLNMKPVASIKSRIIIDNAYSDILISESGVNDNTFLRRGSSYAY